MYDIPDPSREEQVLKRMREILKEQHGSRPMLPTERENVATFAVNVEATRQKFIINRHQNPELVAHVLDVLDKVEKEFTPLYSRRFKDEIFIGGQIIDEVLEGGK